jgi:hypothetical protein
MPDAIRMLFSSSGSASGWIDVRKRWSGRTEENVMLAEFAIEARLRLARWRLNNSVPAIQRRILQILGAADGQRLSRSHLTLKLSKLGCTCNENRIEALQQLEAVGRIRREMRVPKTSAWPGEVWALVAPATTQAEGK